jgi:hypothetical protein
MSEREDGAGDDLDPADWLASQFDPTGELPKQPPVTPPAQPAAPPVAPPPLLPPAAAPVAPPVAPVLPPAPPAAAPAPAAAPVYPPVAPAAQPYSPVAPAQAPLAPQPPAPAPIPPVAPAVTSASTAPPPAAPPATTPPAATPPAAPSFEELLGMPAPPAVPPTVVSPVSPPPPQPPVAPPVQPSVTPSPAVAPSAVVPPPALSPVQPPAAPPAVTPPPLVAPPAAPLPPTLPPVTPASPVSPLLVQPPAAPPVQPPASPATPVPPFPWQLPQPAEPDPLDSGLDGSPAYDAVPPPVPLPFETARLPEVAPDSVDAPAFSEPPPTQAMDAIELERDIPPARPEPATELLAPAAEPTSALDALFGDNAFREYDAGLVPAASESPFVRRQVDADPLDSAGPPPPPAGISRAQKILLWVLGGLLAVLALVALFFLGMRVPDLLGPAPAVATPSASPSPSASAVLALGPVAPGDYAWDQLLGGECLDPFTDGPWAETFTVVDCAKPHPAQLAFRGLLTGSVDGDDSYPGADTIAAQISQICGAAGVVDLAAAAPFLDAQVVGTYPVTQEQWDAGDHSYFCFVSRSSGEPLTGSLAIVQTAPPVPVVVTPTLGVATPAPGDGGDVTVDEG